MKLTREEAKKLNILDVAYSLDMTMIKSSSNEYYWQEHDSLKINTRKNTFAWYSKNISGDTIQLVETIKNVSYKEAMHFLETGEFAEVKIEEIKKEAFIYHLGKYETDFKNARKYLKEERKLSDETIDYFLKKGVLSSVNRKTKDGYEEEVIVFKYLNKKGEIIGGSLQGITQNKERYQGKGYLKQIMYNSEGTAGFSINIGEKIERLIYFEAPIDMMSYYELKKETLENTQLIAMNGLKEAVVARYFIEQLLKENIDIDELDIKNPAEEMKWIAKKTNYFKAKENEKLITLAVDNDEAGKNFIEKLESYKIKLQKELPTIENVQGKIDWNELLQNRKENKTNMNELEKQKEEILSEKIVKKFFNKTSTKDTKKDLVETRQNKNVESTIGDFSDKQKAAPLPEELKTQPLNDLSPNQTGSQRLLHFNIKNKKKSINKVHYHPVKDKELRKLNRYSLQIQQVANWYLNNLADSKVNYFYKEDNELRNITVEFRKEHFMHLTGIFPIKEGQTAEKTLLDFVNGNGNFDNIMISDGGSTFQKLQVLPEIEQILETTAFYFDNVTEIEKLKRLNLGKAIRSEDKDLLMLFKQEEENLVPASIMKVRGNLSLELDKIEEKTILGIYREKDGKIEQLDINKKYIKDNGKEMTDILTNKKLETIEKEEQKNNSYWQIEFNEASGIVKSYKGQILTKELLKEIQELDKLVYKEKLLYKFYFEKIENGEVLERGRIDLGDGEVNNEHYQYLLKELENQTLETKKEKELIEAKEEIKNIFFKESIKEEKNKKEIKEEVANKTVANYIKNNDTVGLNKLLKEGIKEYENTEIYKNYLKTMSKFTTYSKRNIDLIFRQNPNATAVATYQDWQKKFGRYVKKGEKGITILAPRTGVYKDEKGEPILDENNKEKTYTYFKKWTVFDVSQTEGKELPRPLYNLEKEVEGYFNIYKAINIYAKSNNVDIEFKELNNNINGVYYPNDNKIYIQKGLSEAQAIKTLLHELAHAILHKNLEVTKNSYEYNLGELEAESIAYVISNYFGIDTSEYSFGYLKSYMIDRTDYTDLDIVIENIHKQAKEITLKIEYNLNKIKAQNENKLENKLNKKIEEQKQNKEVEEQKKYQEKKQNMI